MFNLIQTLEVEFQKLRLDSIIVTLNEDIVSEEYLFEKEISETQENLLLRKIFDVSREFGLSLKNQKQTNFSTKEISEFLQNIKSPCFSGNWKIEESKSTLHRTTCHYKKNNDFACLYWREAIDGFVMGVGEEERYSRLKSIGYGKNNECVDVFYDSSLINLRWGEVSEELKEVFTNLSNKLQEKKVKLDILGMAEKTVYFKIKDGNEDLKQFRHNYLVDSIKKTVSYKFPEIEIFEVSPRAVIEGEF